MRKHKDHCTELLNTISDYLDGTLDRELCAELEVHLAECKNCQIVFNTTKKTIELYHGSVNENILPVDIEERLYKRLKLEKFLHEKSDSK